ncbi:hypothetical protein [Shewanella oncorhynchi]|uniref:hypothetical protein n=1 Tax=Shewanella oncorhynchi TaxID=2726434 RepID=UPI003D79DBA8
MAEIYKASIRPKMDAYGKVIINSALQLTRQPNEGEVQLLTLSLAQLQQAQYQVLEGQLKG